ncbi:MAG TPA: hypothetical protein VF669_07850 [Tepidisphaeraceae bacterium]
MIPDSLRSYMRRFDARLRQQRLLRAIASGALVFLGAGLVWCLADRMATLGGAARLVLLLVSVGAALWRVAPALVAWLKQETDWRGLAVVMEQRDRRFGERLVTVTSRAEDGKQNGASQEMLARIALELGREVAGRSVRDVLPGRRVAAPWVTVLVAVLAICPLGFIPQLDLPRLAVRFLLPMRETPAATTTRLTVVPGDVDLVEGQALQVKVRALRLGKGSVTLHARYVKHEWFTLNMSADAEGVYAASITPLEQDVEFYVAGGDAMSAVYHARVLRKPVITEFEIKYQYPAYTALTPATVRNSDGLIEGPAGTRATIQIHSSEPLAAATLTAGTQTLAMQPTEDPNVREATITLTKDQKVDLGLSSTRGMVGAAPATTQVRIVPDDAPVAQLLGPAGDLWLSPSAIVPIRFDAGDDFALGLVEVHVRINPFGRRRADDDAETAANFAPGVDLPIPLSGDVRRQVGEVRLDLAALHLAVGDMVSVRLRVEDRSGHSGLSDAIFIVTAPASVTDRQRRLGEALDAAARGAGGGDDDLMVALLGAVAACDVPARADVLAWVADRVVDEGSRGRVSPVLENLARAQRAEMLLKDLENLEQVRGKLPVGDAPAVERARKRVAALEVEVQSQLRRLNVDARQARESLREIAGGWERETRRVVDLAQAAQQAMEKMDHAGRAGRIVERLEAAAQVQTLRPDADLIWARDLQRAATAAANLNASASRGAALNGGGRFSTVLAVLQREHRVRRTQAAAVGDPDDVLAARQQLAEWANSGASPQTALRQMESLTSHASAETVLRNFSNALAIDRALGGEVTAAARRSTRSLLAANETARQMDLAAALDALILQQEALNQELESAATSSGRSNDLSARQSRLLDAVAELVKRFGAVGGEARLKLTAELAGAERAMEAIQSSARDAHAAGEAEVDLPRLIGQVERAVLAAGHFPEASEVRVRFEKLLPALEKLEQQEDAELDTGPERGELERMIDEVRPVMVSAADAIAGAEPLCAAQIHLSYAMDLLERKPISYGATLVESNAGLAALRAAGMEAARRAARARALRIPIMAKAMWRESAATPLPIAAPTRRQNGDDDGSVEAYFRAMGMKRIAPAATED